MESIENYYSVLGIPETATHEDIKKAYKKLAFENHPDRNQDKKEEAELKFKKINEAFQVLGNEQTKAEYDAKRNAKQQQTTTGMPSEWWSGNMFNEEFLYQNFFGGSFVKKNNKKTVPVEQLPVEAKINLALKETLVENKKNIKINYFVSCKVCKGTGIKETGTPRTCLKCNGAGNYKNYNPYKNFYMETICEHCNGLGKTSNEFCETCKGKKLLEESSELSIMIPPGIGHEQIMEFTEVLCKDNTKRKVVLKINVLPQEGFYRKENDLYTSLKISYPEAVLGESISYVHLDGSKLKVKIPSGIDSGQTIRIKKKGFPEVLNPKQFGDLFIVFTIDVPKVLTDSEKKLMIQLLEEFKKKENSNVK